MTKKHRAGSAVLIAALALTLILPALGRAEIFKARMLTGKAPVEPPMINVQIEVTGWTTLDEIRQLQEILGTGRDRSFPGRLQAGRQGRRPVHVRPRLEPAHPRGRRRAHREGQESSGSSSTARTGTRVPSSPSAATTSWPWSSSSTRRARARDGSTRTPSSS
ncbi:MAG: hypothetical protein M0C28_03365 [Candidatus Moduliflexus flocculans]|nr:hypothetical protein [Candidatus Moduliflexus flocculans]